jgi:hypothetical protein
VGDQQRVGGEAGRGGEAAVAPPRWVVSEGVEPSGERRRRSPIGKKVDVCEEEGQRRGRTLPSRDRGPLFKVEECAVLG